MLFVTTGAVVEVGHRDEALGILERQVDLVGEHVGAHRTRDLDDPLERLAREHGAERVRGVVDADELGVGADEPLELGDIGLPAQLLADVPVLDVGAERARNLVERLIGGVLGDHVVTGLHERHEREQVRAGGAVGLEDVIGLDVIVEPGHLLLELGRALDPAVVHLLATELLVEPAAVRAVQVQDLVHSERCDRRLRDVDRGALLVDIEPVLDADSCDLHGVLPSPTPSRNPRSAAAIAASDETAAASQSIRYRLITPMASKRAQGRRAR